MHLRCSKLIATLALALVLNARARPQHLAGGDPSSWFAPPLAAWPNAGGVVLSAGSSSTTVAKRANDLVFQWLVKALCDAADRSTPAQRSALVSCAGVACRVLCVASCARDAKARLDTDVQERFDVAVHEAAHAHAILRAGRSLPRSLRLRGLQARHHTMAMVCRRPVHVPPPRACP